MDQSPTFARQFARLLWLLVNDAANVDEQKMSLRAMVTVCKLGTVTVRTREGRVVANRHLVPVAMSGVAELLQRMRAHGVEKVRFEKGTPARELLGVVKLLADAPRGADAFRKKLADLDASHVEATVVDSAVSSEAPTVVATPAPPPAPAAPPSAASSKASEAAQAIMAELGSRDVSRLTPEEIFRSLDRAKDAASLSRVLDDLVALAEHSVRAAKAPVAATLLHELVAREAKAAGEARKAYAAAFRKLGKPGVLRAIAALIPKRPERKQHYFEILGRAGEEGADAVIEQINQAPTSADRRQLMDVFRELQQGVPALVRMLGDSRWFVVRNAAELLGELVATQAEEALIGLLRHQDDRVRRSATNALLKLGTADAMKRVYEAVNDSSPEVRMQVAAGIATRRDNRTSATLIRAIEGEQDADVQLAMIAALGRVGTAEAVQRLVKIAEPAAGLFRKKDSAMRVAAVQALGEAKTPAAINALRALTDDKDREVREMVSRALAQAAR